MQMTSSYRNLNAINVIEYYLCNTQALARKAGKINGETEYSGSQEYHVVKNHNLPYIPGREKNHFFHSSTLHLLPGMLQY